MKLKSGSGVAVSGRFALLLTICASAWGSGADTKVQVRTKAGMIAGANESGISIFKGVPFAAPPVGDLRWRAPQPVKPWEGVRDASRFGPRCMQLPVFGDMNFRSDGMSEDCLYLNVWTPATDPEKPLPVLVYIYGGGFIAGDGSEPRYDGESMARRGIVTVTLSHRLGVFGFLAHPSLSREADYGASGNYALLDQTAALQWVRDNIHAFGGDPERVTIAGESAGSVAVSAQMLSPRARGLFQGAIGESGSVLRTLRAATLADAEQNGRDFAQHLGAASLAEMRAVSAEAVLQATVKDSKNPSLFGNLYSFAPVIDGYFFSGDPLATYTAGDVAKVPLLVGWNSEEMNYQALMRGKPLTRESFEAVLRESFGANAGDAIALYGGDTDEALMQAATDLAGDQFIAYSTWKWADLHAQTANRVYRYHYRRPRPVMRPEFAGATANLAGGISRNEQPGRATPPVAKGAVHSAEIEYAMGNLPTNRVYDWQPEDYRVSAVMQTFFENFIKRGDPNGLGLPKWPALTPRDAGTEMIIDVETRAQPEKHRARYLFLDRVNQPK
jgi:para-nitrobenzyl esterase